VIDGRNLQRRSGSRPAHFAIDLLVEEDRDHAWRYRCPTADLADPTSIFVDCLERNGVVAQDVEVTLDADSSVASIGARQEGDVAYEPSVRLACTEEGKNRTP
jgi:hypothetical protein